MHNRMLRCRCTAALVATVGLWLFATSLTAQDAPFVRNTEMTLRGKVVDSRAATPLIGANVLTIPAGAGTSTDANGEFTLKIPAASSDLKNNFDSLRITYLGYRPATVAIPDERREIIVTLEATTLLFSETVITATRQPALRSAVPVATALVEIESPQTKLSQNIGEALAHSQSILVKEYGSVSGLKTISLRGAGDGQVLVLQDGVRLNNPQNGGVDAGALSLVGIEKIEIIRGNASAQYGSDAIGGVIHLRSMIPASGFSGIVQTSGGSFGTFNSRMQLGYGSARWRGSVALDRLVSDGDFSIDAAGEARRMNNGSQRREVFARLSGDLSDNLQLNILHRTGKAEQGVPGSLQFPSVVAQQKDLNHLTNFSVEWRRSPLMQIAAQFSTERRDQRYSNPDFFISSRHRVASDIGILQNRSRVAPAMELLIGGEIGRYQVTSTDLGKPERTQRSAFVQAEWRPLSRERHEGWQLLVMPSYRYDDYTDAGERGSPKLAVALNRQNSSRINVHASIGKSFRVPSMNDLFWPAGQFEAGNPNLQPEKGRDVEGGVLYEFSHAGNWQIEFGAFDTKVEGLITWIPDANFRFSPANVDNAHVRGVEVGLAWRALNDRFGWRTGYAYLSAKNDSQNSPHKGKFLVYRPQHKVDLQADVTVQKFTLTGGFQFVDKRFGDAENNVEAPAYSLVKFSLGRRFNAGNFNASVQAEVRNAFDKQYSVIDGYPMPGREFRASLTLKNR